MRSTTLVAGAALTCLLESSHAQTRPAIPLEPISAILDAFKTHQIVALGEGAHGNEQGHAFRLSLIRDPRFATIVNDIVVESGNALHQDVIDRFVRGDDVPYETLRQVWQNTTQPSTGWDRLIYEEFFRAVRTLNASLARERQLRVLLGDPPIDWTKIQSRSDLGRWLNERERFPAEVIRREVLAKQRRALLIYGDGHLFRVPVNENIVSLLGKTQVFIVGTPLSHPAASDLKTVQADETPRTSVPVATSVLDASALSALPAAHLSEVLPFIAGFVTARSEFHAGRPIASARGFFGGGEAEYLVLLVDGVPVADVESGLIDWSVVPAASITRVEASRGPGSALYGDSAVGGVVQTLTERAGTGGRLSLGGGSFATFIADGSYGRRRNGVSFSVAGAARTTNGAFEHSAGKQYSSTGSFDGRFDGFSWRATGAANHQRRDDPGAEVRDALPAANAAPSPYRFDETGRNRQSAAFTIRHDSPGWLPQLRVYTGGRHEDSIRTTLLAPAFAVRQARDLSTIAIGSSFDGEHRFGTPLVLRFGLDLSRESLDSAYSTVQQTGSIDEPTFATNGRRVRSGAFAAASLIPTPRVRVSGALRWDGVNDSGFAQPSSGASPSAWSPRAGVVVYANHARTVSVFGQVSRAFKMPTLDQLFDVRPFPDPVGGTITISNPTLQPQRATNVEAGIAGSTRVSWSAVAYRMDVTNEIDFDVRTFSYGNIGRSEHTGLELEIECRQCNRLRPLASYTLSTGDR
jgi:outer membrane receptor protein involved in Fe transport